MSKEYTQGEKIKPQKGWARHYRNDKDVWEDTCPHGVGHYVGIHSCDGCCTRLTDVVKLENEKNTREQENIGK